MNDLKDKVILITGAGKGGGRLLAKTFAEREAIVAANDISPINVEEIVDHINAKGGRSKAYIEDVAKKVAAQYLQCRLCCVRPLRLYDPQFLQH